MNIFKKIICFILLISLILLPIAVFAEGKERLETENLKDDFFRLHIRANSDSEEDQQLKLKVRDKVLEFTSEIFINVTNKESAMSLAEKNIKTIENIAKKTIVENGYDYDVKVSVRRENFPYKEYDGFFLPEGEYDSLIIEIGAGIGHNWWCVLFPAVCLSGASEKVETDVEKVPEKFRISNNIDNDKIVFKCWIFDAVKRLFD